MEEAEDTKVVEAYPPVLRGEGGATPLPVGHPYGELFAQRQTTESGIPPRLATVSGKSTPPTPK